MDIKQLRQTLKLKWLTYYQENYSWLVKMQTWRSYDGVRRPLSGYILATLSTLEPQLKELLPLLLELNNNPDHIVAALGLNFNPDEELLLFQSPDSEKLLTKPPQEKKQVLLRIVPSIEQKQQSVSVVKMSKPVNDHSHLIREEKLRKSDRLGVGRSPTVTTQSITPQIPITYQFTGIPVKEISYISATTNARSLPAWMDEFCPGVK